MLYSNLFYEVVNYLVVVVIWKKKKTTVNITIKNVTEDCYGEVTVIHYYQLKQPFFLTYGTIFNGLPEINH